MRSGPCLLRSCFLPVCFGVAVLVTGLGCASSTEAGGSGGVIAGGGGVTGAGGVAGSGGIGAGGTIGSGGSKGSGGALGSGGRVGSGGATGGGGSGTGGGDSGSGGSGSGGAGTGGGPWPPTASYANPILWEDLADDDVFRVGDTYYYSASTMHYSPGAPVLRSFDLINWEYAGHSVPVLDWSTRYDLSGANAYVKGVWASTLRYRASNKTFYWLGCIEFGKTYVYTATAVEGPWTKHPAMNTCLYDAGMLIDDDDKIYVAYGNPNPSVAQLSADGFGVVKQQQVFTTPASITTLEGSHFHKRGKYYYIVATRPANAEYVLRATSPFGPYELQPLVVSIGAPVAGAGNPHQGSLVDTQNGDWYYMAFIDSYPGGRIPVLAPVTWVNDWPVVTLVGGKWGASYPYPNVPRPPRAMKPRTGVETFSTVALGHDWEWNHNPDNTKWTAGNGLTLQTVTVTNDLYAARNTLTRRILGPTSTATIVLDYAGMKDGDQAGLAMLRHQSAWVGVKKSGGATAVAMVNSINMADNNGWRTTSTGTTVASSPISGGKIWLRVSADIRPGTGKQAKFSYSLDGQTFTPLGTAFTLNNDWPFFMGYRYAIFNFATAALGGSVKVSSFELTSP